MSQTETYTDEDSRGESFADVDVDVAFGARCEEIKLFFIDNASIFKMVHFHAKSRELFLSCNGHLVHSSVLFSCFWKSSGS